MVAHGSDRSLAVFLMYDMVYKSLVMTIRWEKFVQHDHTEDSLSLRVCVFVFVNCGPPKRKGEYYTFTKMTSHFRKYLSVSPTLAT